MKKILSFLTLFNQAFGNLKGNDPIRMAAATAFFSFFALPPIVIVLSTVFSPVFKPQQVRGQVFQQLGQLFGSQSANQLKEISTRLQPEKSNFLWTILGSVLLLLASTALFMVIKNSLNQLWNIKAAADRTFLNTLKDRAIALALIVFSGLLMSGSLMLDQVMTPRGGHAVLNRLLDQFSSTAFMAVWFATLFKYLPDLRIPWKAIGVGALVTSLLYDFGEMILSRLLTHGLISSRYGTSGAFILILLFVFYASLIFYYGAAFTRQYAHWIHLDAEPDKKAVLYEINEVEAPKKGQ